MASVFRVLQQGPVLRVGGKGETVQGVEKAEK